MKSKEDSAELMSLMFTIGRFMRDPKRESRNERQVSFLQFETLHFVRDRGRPHMREVARHFLITPPAATLLVGGLVKDRLLSRVFDKSDRRTVCVEITPLGRELLVWGKKEKVRKIKAISSALSADEHKKLIAILRKMVKTSEQWSKSK